MPPLCHTYANVEGWGLGEGGGLLWSMEKLIPAARWLSEGHLLRNGAVPSICIAIVLSFITGDTGDDSRK